MKPRSRGSTAILIFALAAFVAVVTNAQTTPDRPLMAEDVFKNAFVIGDL